MLGQFATSINPDSFALSKVLVAFDSVAYWNQVFAASTSNSINVLAGNCLVSNTSSSTKISSLPSLVPTIPTAAQLALAGTRTVYQRVRSFGCAFGSFREEMNNAYIVIL